MPRVSSIAAIGLIVALALAACTVDGEGPNNSPSSTPATASATSQGTQPSPPSLPTLTPSARNAPATGQLFTLYLRFAEKRITFRAPTNVKWNGLNDKSTMVVLKTKDFGPGTEEIAYLTASVSSHTPDNLGSLAQRLIEAEEMSKNTSLALTGFRVVNSVKGFVLQGTGPRGERYIWAGLDSDNVLAKLDFLVPKNLKPANWVDPTLASIEWK
ncbi:hypothetical protein [Psychromicrobium lacuslunae]|uniref:Lipoprotein n=1 Tax=Psychromicrobium lacuslunae TaxID=1618207 RepID=A0A0D4BYW0_9MICC|nr:hypothetical protein [Psychromicrobium lacuslunae]AJT41622.1 hypothetical protein UM93_09075 [Psychromicrobium lacuslunae]